jgi:formate dehydrogenase iron-sulfur subunit
MVAMANTRATQLKAHSNFPNAGVYDPQSINGTHVIYVLHDATQPELYALPKTPEIPPSYTVWKWIAKPAGLAMAVLGLFGVFFHRIVVGPKLPQPEPVPVEDAHPDEVEAARKEKP